MLWSKSNQQPLTIIMQLSYIASSSCVVRACVCVCVSEDTYHTIHFPFSVAITLFLYIAAKVFFFCFFFPSLVFLCMMRMMIAGSNDY